MRSPMATYGLTLGAVLALFAGRWLLDPVLGDSMPASLFYLAVVFASWLGGWRPAVLAAGMGFLASLYFFVPYRESFTLESDADVVGLGLYLVICAVIAGFGETMRAAQNRALQRADELDAVMRATPTAIWIAHDPQCLRITGNPASYQILGMPEGTNASPEALGPRGRKFQEFREGKPLPASELPLQQAAAQGIEVHGAELRLVFDDGSERFIYGSAAPLRDAHGAVRGAAAAFVDVTELKAIEQTLREADRRKDEFLATLAHELRNPLNPIRTSLEIIKRANGDLRLIEDARRTMERQGAHLVRLIDDLLDLSRVTRDKLVLHRERIELASVVHHAVEACQGRFDQARLMLHVALPAEPIYMNADPVRLSQVLVNLLTNAAKYTPAEGQVWLSVESEEAEVLVTVRDTGEGIAPDMIVKVFEMFHQVERSSGKMKGGLGIGLTLVKRLVELHGGTVAAESEGEDRGSTFVVRLPGRVEAAKRPELAAAVSAAAVSTVSAGAAVSTVSAGAAGAASGTVPAAARRILVVDDNFDSALSVTQLLEMAGHETRTAFDGLEAVEVAGAYKPEVVLLDIGLPWMSGYDVCRAIREQPWGRDVLIIALSGWGQAEDRRKSMEAGFNRHLVKPLAFPVLQKLLETWPAAHFQG